MKYHDYCYVDTAMKDVRHRNNVSNIDEISLPDPPVECYCSMFRFGREYLDHCLKTGSVRDCPALPHYCEYLWFDIDDEDLDQARERAIQLLMRIESEYDVSPADLQICFSGSKAYHIGIPAELFGVVPDSQNAQKFKVIARRLAGDIPIDTSIYERNRLWRMPGTVNSKSGLYKTHLTHEELAGLDTDAIKKLAGAKREIQAPAFDDLQPNAKLASMYEYALAEQPTSRQTEIKQAVEKDKACINKLFEGVEAGSRNEAAVRLADHLKRLGEAREAAVERLREWNAKNRPPMPESEIIRTVQSVYEGNYDYGCNDPVLDRLCDPSCPLYKAGYDDKPIHVSFVALPDGSFLEMLFDSQRQPDTFFARFDGKQVTYVDKWRDMTTGKQYLPINAQKIIRTRTIHLPSRAVAFGSESELIREIHEFIERYLVVSPFFHTISTYYVLLSWVYDNFTVLPYLRSRGDYGTGKSRFLQTVGALCYKPIFCMGAATVSPIFRLIEMFKGTVIIDEADFNDSDEANKIVKILNTGYQQGFPMLLTEPGTNSQLEPRSFDVYGPKLIATRREFKDKALESRCVTETMEPIRRLDVPINLPDCFWDEAKDIRNKLLTWRFSKWGKIDITDNCHHSAVEPRLAQIMTPLLNIIEDETVRDEFIAFMKQRNIQIIEERGDTLDAKVAEAICELWGDSPDKILVGQITDEVNSSLDNPKFEFSPRKTGHVLRKTFNLDLEREGKGYCLMPTKTNIDRLINIAKRFGIEWGSPPQCAQRTQRAQMPPETDENADIFEAASTDIQQVKDAAP